MLTCGVKCLQDFNGQRTCSCQQCPLLDGLHKQRKATAISKQDALGVLLESSQAPRRIS